MIPRYYQTQANDAAWQYLNDKPGNPLIVLPTGAGKSLVIAMLCKQAVEFGCRVVVLQHRKELIVQNTEKIQILIPEIKIGIYSAGLKSKQVAEDVVCAGIQSVYRKAFSLGRRELILIDEAHLVSSNDETMYGQFLADVKTGNPSQRVVGLTATPFRTGEGPICRQDKLFQRICYEAYTGDLIQQGFLCEITNRPADRMVDTSLIKTRGGEFIEHDAQLAFDTTDNVSAACAEIVTKCHDRHSVLLFAAGVGHAEHIAEKLGEMTGEPVAVVTGETFPMERAATLADFKAGRLRWLVNCDVLTTGFDAPCIDAICVLRATMSPGLFAQIVGRGLRKHESKTDCLVLDFGENIKRHGSLDDPKYGRASESFGGSASSTPAENNGRGKECPNCGLDVAARSAECMDCGFVFPVKHEASADHESAITGQTPPEVWNVVSVGCARHTKRNEPDAHPTFRIDYDCQQDGMMKQTISEWVCIEHSGYAKTKAGLWWQARSISECPDDVGEAIDLFRRGACRNPVKLTTERDGKYFRIKSVEFDEDRPESWREPDEPVEVLGDGGEFDEVPF